MNSRMIVSLAMATMSLIIAAGCSSPKSKKKSPEEIQAEAAASVGTHYTTVVFEKGKSSLNALNKEDIQKLAALAHKNPKPIEEIRILAWADKEYPNKVEERANTSEIILASERARTIKEYLEEELKELEDIDSYNMAKRPGLLSKLFKNEEYEVKSAVEKSGTTGSRLPDGSVSYTKASKALIVIDYEGDEDQ